MDRAFILCNGHAIRADLLAAEIRGHLDSALAACKPFDPVARTPDGIRSIRDDLRSALAALGRLETALGG